MIFFHKLVSTYISKIGFTFALSRAAGYKVTSIMLEDSCSTNRSLFVSLSFGKNVKCLVNFCRCKFLTGHILFMVFVTLRTIAFVAVWACHVLQVTWDENSAFSVCIGARFENLTFYSFNIACSKIEKLLVNFWAT